MKKIRIPLGDGSSNVQSVDQTLVDVAAELLDLLDAARDKPSKGIISFAKNVLFAKVLADDKAPVQSLSLGLSQEVGDVLRLFGRTGLVCVASDYRPHESTPFAALHLSEQSRSMNIWFSVSEPHVTLEFNGAAPTMKPLYPLASTVYRGAAPKPKLRVNIPTAASSDKRQPSEMGGEEGARSKRIRRPEPLPVVDAERAAFWENQLSGLEQKRAPAPAPTPDGAVRTMTLGEQLRRNTPSGFSFTPAGGIAMPDFYKQINNFS